MIHCTTRALGGLFAVLALAAIPATSAFGIIALPNVTITSPTGSLGTSFLSLNSDGTFSGSGGGSNYSWTLSGSNDPLLLWSFGASTPGTWSMTFSTPVLGGPYNTLKNQAGVTVSDAGAGSNPSSVSSVSIDGQVPGGTSVPAVLLSGNFSTPNGVNTVNSYGNASTTQAFGSPFSMSEVVTFTLVSPDADGSAAFSGNLLLSNVVPEPASLSLLGAGAAGLLMRRKRR